MKRTLLAAILLSTSLAASAQAIQRVVIEEHTGAWCGFCPEGAMIIDEILTQEPEAIGVAIHQGDAMQISMSSLIRSFYGPAFPQATINRQGAPISRGSWASAVTAALQDDPLCSVSFDSVSLNPATRVLYARLKTTFHRDTSAQLRLNLYLTEDNVTGSGSGYDQVNYFNGTSGHPYQGAGDPIVGFVHNHVLRHGLGSAWGTVNVFPGTVSANQEVTYAYTYTVPANWNIDNMHLVAMVNLHGGQLTYQRPTLNADEMPLALAVSNDEGVHANSNILKLWPNPSSGATNISFSQPELGDISVDVYAANGQRIVNVAQGITNGGLHTVVWDGRDHSGNALPAGLYFVRATTADGKSLTQRLVLNPR